MANGHPPPRRPSWLAPAALALALLGSAYWLVSIFQMSIDCCGYPYDPAAHTTFNTLLPLAVALPFASFLISAASLIRSRRDATGQWPAFLALAFSAPGILCSISFLLWAH